MTQEPIILKRKDDDYGNHSDEGLADGGTDDQDSWDDELKEEEEKSSDSDGWGAETDDEDGNY